jgi:uncharacterized alkaline shock family protein YloU
MISIDVAFDIATSLSVIGAAGMFVLKLVKENAKNRSIEIREKRINIMSQTIDDFTGLLLEGSKIIDKWNKAKAENKKIDPNDLISFCREVYTHIDIKVMLKFDVWAKESEKEIFEKIKKMLSDYMSKYKNALETNNKDDFPNFSDLIQEIKKQILILSSELRRQVVDIEETIFVSEKDGLIASKD